MKPLLSFMVMASLLVAQSGCTLVGAGIGGAIGASRQPSSGELQPVRDSRGRMTYPSRPMSTAGHVALGALAGAVVDVIAVTAGFYAFAGLFEECKDEPHC